MTGQWNGLGAQAAEGPGGPGDDDIYDDSGDTSIDGGGGNDTIGANGGGDHVSGDAGNDVIDVRDGGNDVSGGDGNDIIYAGDGGNYVSGGDGNDGLTSASGGDTMFGGQGDDHVVWRPGGSLFDPADFPTGAFDGGGGTDAFTVRLGVASDETVLAIDLASGRITVGGSVMATFSSFERLDASVSSGPAEVVGGELADRLYSEDGGHHTLIGGGGDDAIIVGGEHDRVFGDDGSDWCSLGQGGSARIDLGAGDDIGGIYFSSSDPSATASYIDGGDGEDQLQVNFRYLTELGQEVTVSGSKVTIAGVVIARLDDFESAHVDVGHGSLTFRGLDGDDDVRGGDRGSSLSGGAGGDWLRGQSSEDTLVGGSGRYRLNGRGGDDSIIGNRGEDTLTGSTGADTISGGLGADFFRYTGAADSGPDRFDTILDFSQESGDRIDLAAIDAGAEAKGPQHLSFIGHDAFSGAGGELRYDITDGHTTLMADVHGSQAQLSIVLVGEISFVEDDFIL